MSATPGRRPFTVRQILAAPTLLAILSITGLIAALVGDGAYDVFSWIALSTPIATCVGCLYRARR